VNNYRPALRRRQALRLMENAGWLKIDRYTDEEKAGDYDAVLLPGGTSGWVAKPLTALQSEVARLVQKELGKSISQSYLSQMESGARPHMSNSTRMLLARFFKVHPGYLVDDPEGFANELLSDVGVSEDKLDLWLVQGAERFTKDPELHHALLAVARHSDSRMCLVLLGEILENPGLADRLMEVLRGQAPPANRKTRRRS